MVKTQSPKLLWDHCLQLSTLIYSLTMSDIFAAQGDVPEKIMTSDTVDISQIHQFGWYDWMMFHDSVLTFPDETIVLGKYLGPAPNMGSAHMVKILKSNGQVVQCSTLWLLTPDKLSNSDHIALCQKFGLDGNSIKCAYNNPILDKNIYHVEFDDGDIMELTANAITELMYSQCDIDGNQFLLLDNFAEYRKSNTALTTIPEQESVDTIGCI